MAIVDSSPAQREGRCISHLRSLASGGWETTDVSPSIFLRYVHINAVSASDFLSTRPGDSCPSRANGVPRTADSWSRKQQIERVVDLKTDAISNSNEEGERRRMRKRRGEQRGRHSRTREDARYGKSPAQNYHRNWTTERPIERDYYIGLTLEEL